MLLLRIECSVRFHLGSQQFEEAKSFSELCCMYNAHEEDVDHLIQHCIFFFILYIKEFHQLNMPNFLEECA